MSSSDRFHDAARKGDAVALREGTWKDYDRSDDRGMTPAMWAAASGHVEALKILVEKGASVNRCDYFGRTALHHAAGNGHVTCVVFLVAFGVNIWSLDNNFNTPLDVAAIHNRMTVVSCLDRAAADQMSTNVRTVKKQRESAIRDAERRAKRFQKSPQEMELAAAAEPDGMKLSSSRSFPSCEDSSGSRPGTSPSYVSLTLSSRLSGRTAMSELRPYSSNFETGSQPNMATGSSYSTKHETGSPPYVKSASLLSLFAKKIQRKPRPFHGSASGNNSTVESMQTARKPVGSLFSRPVNGTNGKDQIQVTVEESDIERVRPSTPFRAYSQPELSVHQEIRSIEMDEIEATYTATQSIDQQHQHGVRDIDHDIQPSLESKVGLHIYGYSNRLDATGSATNGVSGHQNQSNEGPEVGNGWGSDREKLNGATGTFSTSNNNRKRLGVMDGIPRTQSGSSNSGEGTGSSEGGYKHETEWTNNRERLEIINGRSKFEGLNGRSREESNPSDKLEKDELRSTSGNGWISDSVRPGITRIESRVMDARGSTLDAFLQAYGLLDYVPVLAREKLDMNSLTLVTDLDLKDLGIPLGPRRVLLDAVARRRTTLNNPGRIADSTF